MTTDLPSTLAQTQTILTDAVSALQQKSQQRPDAQAVTTALLEAERAAKRQRLNLPLEALYGTWRLGFTAPKKPHYQSGLPVGKGFYIPGLATASIQFLPSDDPAAAIAIRNQLQVGALTITFTGPARYPGQKNLLVFDFDTLTVKLLNVTLYRGKVRSGASKTAPFADLPIGKLPFFAFFLATGECVAARGRGGGLALWVRSEDT